MKKILLVGSSSDVAITLFEKYGNLYDFIRVSRDTKYSDFEDFNILNTLSFPEIDSLDGIVYFPGNINLKPFRSLSVNDFLEDYNIHVVGLLNILKYYKLNCI